MWRTCDGSEGLGDDHRLVHRDVILQRRARAELPRARQPFSTAKYSEYPLILRYVHYLALDIMCCRPYLRMD